VDTLKDVLLYLARHVPAGHTELAAMEAAIEAAFTPQPAPAPPESPAG
jgi:hypothetical protein